MRLLAALAAVFAAVLPARVWPSLDVYVPVTRAAVPSSVLTLLGGAILGIGGFLDFARQRERERL